MLALACDHGGFSLMHEIKAHLGERGVTFQDFGTFSDKSCDYPEFAALAARAVVSGECERAILVCGTGIGMSIAANKVPGVRAALCSDCFSAEMARRHNDANVLALGARVTGSGLALRIIDIFLETDHDGGRHGRRVSMLSDIEAGR